MQFTKDKIDVGYINDFDNGQYRAYMKINVSHKAYQHFSSGKNMVKLVEKQYDNRANQYITLNSFSYPKRNTAAVGMLQAYWLDLDCEKWGYKKENVFRALPYLLDEAHLFTPSYVVDSGHGLYLIWRLEARPVYAEKFIKLWDKVEHAIADRFEKAFKDLFAVACGIVDYASLDSTRVLRIPGTVNPKHGEKVLCQVLEQSDQIYTLFEFADEVLPLTHSEFAQKMKQDARQKREYKQSTVKFKYAGFEQKLLAQRAGDISKLVKLRKGNLIGRREVLLFLVANTLGQITELDQVRQAIHQLNGQFVAALPACELRSIETETELLIRESANPKSKRDWYKYKNQTIVKLLKITDDEAKEMATLVTENEKKRRVKLRRTELAKDRKQERGRVRAIKSQVTEERNAQVKRLKKSGFTNSEIAKKLGIHRNTIRNILKGL